MGINKQEIYTGGGGSGGPDPRTLGIAVAAIVLLAALVFGAIQLLGGDDEDEAGEPQPQTTQAAGDAAKAAFVARAERVCSKAERRIKSLTFPDTPDQAASYFRQVRDVLRDTVRGIKAAAPPKQDRRFLQRMFAKLKASDRVLVQLVAAAEARDATQIQQLTGRFRALTQQADTAALQYGLGKCAED